MSASVGLVAAHWMYLAGVAVITVTMVCRANVVVPSILSTFLVVLAWSGSPVQALGSIFDASFVAAKELFNIFLVIALITALLNALKELRSDVRMVEPFRAVMKNGHIAFFVLATITYGVSLFFWPTPAVPLVSAVLLPAAIAAGLPPIAGAAAMAIAGQGMALSSDYIVGVAPGISAKASGALVTVVADRALALSLVTGVIALLLVYLSLRKHFVAPNEALLTKWQAQAGNGASEALADAGSMNKVEIALGTAEDQPPLLTECDVQRELSDVERSRIKWSKLFAVLTPTAFLIVIALMVLPSFIEGLPTIKGGDAAALVGGMAGLLMILATLSAHGARRMLDVSAEHVTEGFVFAFKAMGSVLPIAGFFFLGASETAAGILGLAPSETPNLLFDLINSCQHWIPQSEYLVAFGVLLVGMITGVDGSGFAGLPLTGALSGALAPASGGDAATLAAVGQMGSVWTGGGTLIAWSSLIAVAGFARVPVQEAVRVLAIPVLVGLASSTLFAVIVF